MYNYISVETLKGTAALNIASSTGTDFDFRLREIGESITRTFDAYMSRVIHPMTRTMYFSGDDSTKLLVPDLVALTTLKEDTNDDGTFETTWGTADYILSPFNADPTSDWGRPYTSVLVSLKTGATQDVFLAGVRNYELTGTWGWRSVTVATGRGCSASIDSTATAIAVNGTLAGAIEIGMTLLVDSEQVYVRAHGSGTSITVDRAVNGSTAGTHGSGSAIRAYTYPEPIVEAALIQAARLWQRRNSGYAGTIGFPDSGVMMVFKKIDDDVRLMLNPFRRLGA